MTANTSATKLSGTRAWNRSLIELTNTTRGDPQVYGWRKAAGWMARPNPGPLVLGSPSSWYLADPIAFSRRASASA
jgi:hypothetical protein